MYKRNPSYVILFIALFSSFLFFSPSSAHNKSHQASLLHKSYKGIFSKIYAFGDSYTDTGNAQLLAGSSYTNKPINQSCDGRLVIDFLCESLSIPPLPPYKSTSANFSSGVNFAVAGSSGFAGHKTSHPLIWKEESANLQTQVAWFKKFLQEVECKGKTASSCQAELENALFWIGPMGVDNYGHSIWSSISHDMRLTEMSVHYICKLIQARVKRKQNFTMPFVTFSFLLLFSRN